MRLLKQIFFFFLLAMCVNANAQPTGIQVNKSLSTEQLVRDVFLKSGCKNVFNIKSINNGLSIGYFEDDSFIFGFREGVIISSGDVELAEGPNAEIESTFAYANQSDDPDLNTFAPGSIFDVGGIEFDFIPVGETVTFEYAFGSEEYCEFVGSMFNDVFGFFVSGPGINGPFANNAINVALVPGTNEFVAINSINHATNSDLYIKNELLVEADECDIAYDPLYLDQIEYDGMTEQLQATIDVVPCETYRIRLVIADVGDDILDSGVFLGAQTFDISGDVQITARSEGSDEPVAVEGCRNGEFLFQRLTNNNDQDLVVYFTINSSSTATSGSDYTSVPDSIVIPAGATSATLTIEALEDMLVETEETIFIEIQYPCDCVDQEFATLTIRDREPLEYLTSSIQVCAGQSFSISPSVNGGLVPYTYQWENGVTSATLSTSVDMNTDFLVTVTDFCGDSIVANLPVELQPVPEASISGEINFCEGVNSFVEIDLGGNPPWAFQYIIDGDVAGSFSNVTENPYLLPVAGPGIYELGIFTDANCIGVVAGSVVVNEIDNQINYEVTPTSCFDNADGNITWSLSNGAIPVNIIWSPPVNNNLNPTELFSNNYNLLVTDSNGCQYEAMIEVPVAVNANPDCRPFDLYVPNSFSPNNDGINDTFRIFPSENSNIELIKDLHIFNRWGGLVFHLTDFTASENMP
ncbi:MAG: choice-of-anchor L domain-containing protein, partial [Bacteroidota bacterium]